MSDELMEQGRRLASEREDLIAAGVDHPRNLLIPLAPDSATTAARVYPLRLVIRELCPCLWHRLLRTLRRA